MMLVGYGYLIRVKLATGQILLVFEVKAMRELIIADRMELEQGLVPILLFKQTLTIQYLLILVKEPVVMQC